MDFKIASSISNGSKKAYILNTVKVENNKIVLYSSIDDTFKSEAALPPTNDAVTEPVNGMYNVDIIEIGEETDLTTVLNNLIQSISDGSNGGGTIKFGAGVYKLKYLLLAPKVRIEGSGVGVTILKRIKDTVVPETVDDNNNKGFICVPVGAYGCSIENLSICGPDTSYSANGIDPTIVNYATDTEKVSGIFVFPNIAKSFNSSSNNADVYSAIVSNTGLRNGGNRNQKFMSIKNITIFGMNGSGISIGNNNSDITVENILVSHCRYSGIYNAGLNNIFSDIVSFANGLNGILETGNGSKYNNIEITYAGRYDHVNSAGMNLDGATRCMISNMAVSKCFCKGYVITGSFNSLHSCISDANGRTSSLSGGADLNNPKDVPHILLGGSNHIINILISNSIKTTASPIASHTIQSSGNPTNCILNIIADGLNTSDNDAMIGGVAISVINDAQIISGNNILTYIP